ncbi:DUF3592 domain-containing protein [Streptomyces sp. NPDC050610]|uniref:DUF3592 domain-containing protein n=1 Tax=Streptomyces sp. NPDC050610 TaxID=3157097 RepID=UPI003413868D
MVQVRLIGLLFLLAGLLGLASVTPRDWRSRQLGRRGVRTSGTVIDHVADDEGVSTMVVEFPVERDRSVSISVHPVDSPRGVLPLGEQIEVLHLRDTPMRARTVTASGGLLRGNPLVVVVRLILLFLEKEIGAEKRLRRSLRENGVPVMATVTGYRYDGEDEDRREPVLCPLIEFTDHQGRIRSFVARAHRDDGLPPIGREMAVIHLPGPPRWLRPTEATPSDIPSRTEVTGRFLLLCACLAIGGYLFTLSSSDL